MCKKNKIWHFQIEQLCLTFIKGEKNLYFVERKKIAFRVKAMMPMGRYQPGKETTEKHKDTKVGVESGVKGNSLPGGGGCSVYSVGTRRHNATGSMLGQQSP